MIEKRKKCVPNFEFQTIKLFNFLIFIPDFKTLNFCTYFRKNKSILCTKITQINMRSLRSVFKFIVQSILKVL